MTRLSKSDHVSVVWCICVSRPQGTAHGFTDADPAAAIAATVAGALGVLHHSALCVSPILKGSTKTMMMHFLRGIAVPRFKLLRLQNPQLYWICDQKTDGVFDLQSKSTPQPWTVYLGVQNRPRNVRIVLPEIVLTNMWGQGRVVSLVLQGLLNCSQQTSFIDCTSCVGQTPVESWREAERSPIRLTLRRCANS